MDSTRPKPNDQVEPAALHHYVVARFVDNELEDHELYDGFNYEAARLAHLLAIEISKERAIAEVVWAITQYTEQEQE